MLTIASPKADPIEINIRAQAIAVRHPVQSCKDEIQQDRMCRSRSSILSLGLFPLTTMLDAAQLFEQQAEQEGILHAPR